MHPEMKTAIFFVLACLLSGCASGVLPDSALDYDHQPGAVVVAVDIHYPGVPLPTRAPSSCYRPYLPSLRIWGDGFVYLDERIQNSRSAVLVGTLRPDTLREVFLYLNSQAFFTNWTHPGANPAGTWFKIGATLKNRPTVEYSSGDLTPALYRAVIAIITPELVHLNELAKSDPRAEAILTENEGCNKP